MPDPLGDELVTVPIACSLTAGAARSQMGEWRELLTASVVAAERISPTTVSFQLGEDLDQLSAIVRLAQREKACCPFFDFAILIDTDRVALRISVPADAIDILDSFARAGIT